VIGDGQVLNQEGLRFADEFVRHKALDALGDLYLAGLPIIGAFSGVRSGHALNRRLLEALFADHTAYRVVRMPADAYTLDWQDEPERVSA
jgi:UDP-3-O-[3-hydroxymyristoyl] N-acetylglucosamine deacetylase